MSTLENLDLSALETQKPVTKDVEKTEVAATVVDRDEVETVTVTFEDIQKEDFPMAKLVERVANGEIELSLERKAWAGVRGRKRIAGFRKRMRDLGFLIDESSKVVDPDGNGRLSSATYTNGTEGVRVHYAIEPNYGHRVRSAS